MYSLYNPRNQLKGGLVYLISKMDLGDSEKNFLKPMSVNKDSLTHVRESLLTDMGFCNWPSAATTQLEGRFENSWQHGYFFVIQASVWL